MEVLWCALNLKYLNPNNVFICKGNHENYSTYSKPNLTQSEIKNQLADENVQIKLRNLLDFLPVAIFINFNGSVFQACHGAFDHRVSGYIVENDKFESGELKVFR